MKTPPLLARMLGLGQRAVLGVDLGTSALKLVELATVPAGLKVVAAQTAPIAAGAIKEGKIVDAPAVGEALRSAVVASRSHTKNVAFAIPDAMVLNWTLELPADLPETEMEMQVLLEAEKNIPYPLDEVALDFTTTETTADGQAKLFVAAIRRELIDSLEEVAGQAGLTLKIVDAERFCFERVHPLIFRHVPKSKSPEGQEGKDSATPVAIMDLGAANMRFYVLEDGQLIYNRDESFEPLTQGDTPTNTADPPAPQKPNDPPDSPDHRDGLNTREELIARIEHLLQTFHNSSQKRIGQLVLCGGAALNPLVAKRTEAKINLPVVLGNPFAWLEKSERLNHKRLTAMAPFMLLATGLALRGVH